MLMAIDLGYGAVKTWTGGNSGGLLPSHVSVNGRARVHLGWTEKRAARPTAIRTRDGSFYVGAGAHNWGRPVENLDFDRFLGTPEMRALVYGTFELYGVASKSLDLVVGMPLAFLTGEDDEIRRKAARVKRWLRGNHGWQTDGVECRQDVASVVVASQAAGTLFDYCLDEQGQMSPERAIQFKKEIGILNVGMNTVDLLVTEGGKTIQRLTAGSTLGVRRLLDLCNPDGLYTIGELDRKLRSGTLDTDAAMEVWSREVLGFVERQWGKAFKRFSRIICAGGGAILLRSPLERRFGGSLYMPDDPVMSVARGLYRYALMRQARRRTAHGQTEK